MPGNVTNPAARQGDNLIQDLHRNRHFYLFISPFFILFAVFGLYPLLFSFYLSFTRWDGLTPRAWVGMDNFALMLDDEVLAASLWNTLIIGLLYIPVMLFLAFVFANILHLRWLRLRALFRTAVFIPCVTPMVVIALVFGLIFSSEKGVLNFLLAQLGKYVPALDFGPVQWLTSEQWSKVSVALLVLWRWTGYNMVLMLAGLQGIPDEYFEAATTEGASALQRIRHITIPLMRPTFLFCAILSLLGTIYMFDEVFVMTRGGPGLSSTNFGLYLFNKSFVDFRFGYASCMAYSVAAGVFLITLMAQRFNRTDTE